MLELYLLLGLVLSIVLYKDTMKKAIFVILLWPMVLLKSLKKAVSNEQREEHY